MRWQSWRHTYCSFVQRFTPTTVKRLVDYSVLFVLRACTEQKLFSAISEAERRATRGEKEGRANPATVHSGEQNRLVMVQVRTKGASPLANRRRRGGDAGTGNIAPGKPVPVFSSATGGWRSLVANSELIPTWRVWDRHLNRGHCRPEKVCRAPGVSLSKQLVRLSTGREQKRIERLCRCLPS